MNQAARLLTVRAHTSVPEVLLVDNTGLPFCAVLYCRCMATTLTTLMSWLVCCQSVHCLALSLVNQSTQSLCCRCGFGTVSMQKLSQAYCDIESFT